MSKSTSCGPARRANQLPLLESERELTTVDGSGRRCWELYRRFVPDGCCLRTSMASLLLNRAWYSPESYLTWSVQGITPSHWCFRLALSARRTSEIGSLSSHWITPTANTSDFFNLQREAVRKEAKGYPSLGTQAFFTKPWLTPTGNRKAGTNQGQMHIFRDGTPSLIFMGAGDASPETWVLSVQFVEALMGFPPNWTDLP